MASEGLAGTLATVLGGKGLLVQNCDSEPAGKPLSPVRLRKNVCYVVLAVFLNEQDEVLMIQEAKRECRGAWYLPAGRMEPGETIVEAMQREVKEEAGLLCEPVTLLSVEERGASWIRFVFLARPTELPCSVVCQRLVATFTTVQSVWVLVGTMGTPHHITACGFTPMEQRGGIKVAVLRLLQECLTLHNLAVETKGLLDCST
ncbi:hypothetical protein STEG23_002645 [Scotinomys teguina]